MNYTPKSNKTILSIIFWLLAFFFLIYFFSDIKIAFNMTFFTVGMFLFNFNIIYFYQEIKNNNYRIKTMSTLNSRIYFFIITPLIPLLFILFLPRVLLIAAFIITLCLLSGLFIFNILKGLFK